MRSILILILLLGFTLAGCVSGSGASLGNQPSPNEAPSNSKSGDEGEPTDKDEKAEHLTVAFYAEEGSVFAEMKDIAVGSLIDAPEEPTKKAHTFIGWFTDTSFETQWVFETSTVDANTQLYAKWDANEIVYTTRTLSNATYETNYAENIGGADVEGGTVSYSVKEGSKLPTGIVLDSESGDIYGKVTAKAGSYSFIVSATCQETGHSKDAGFSLSVNKKHMTVEQPVCNGRTELIYGMESPTITTATKGGTIRLDEERLLSVGENVAYAWTFTPGDTMNYEWSGLQGFIDLDVGRAQAQTPTAVFTATFGTEVTTAVLRIEGTGYEYMVEGGTWQNQNVFYDLTPDKDYVFYVRFRGTETHMPSPAKTLHWRATPKTSDIFNIVGDALCNLTDLGKGMETIIIPSEVSVINAGAFSGSAARTIVVPEDLQEIQTVEYSPEGMAIENSLGAFGGCLFLESLTLPLVLQSQPFASELHFGAVFGTQALDGTVEVEHQLSVFYMPSSLTSLTINGTAAIPVGVLDKCKMITSIIVEDTVTQISKKAFEGVVNLETITLPFVGTSSVEAGMLADVFGAVPSTLRVVTVTQATRLGYGAFQNALVTEINLPDTLEEISPRAFAFCTELETITIPENVQYIGAGAFVGCSGLVSVSLPFIGIRPDASGADALLSTVFHDSSVVWGVLVSQLGSSTKNCMPASLRMVRITGTATVKYGALSFCTMLERVEIASTVTQIESMAFAACVDLQIYVAHSSKPDLWADTWGEFMQGQSSIHWNCDSDCAAIH